MVVAADGAKAGCHRRRTRQGHARQGRRGAGSGRGCRLAGQSGTRRCGSPFDQGAGRDVRRDCGGEGMMDQLLATGNAYGFGLLGPYWQPAWTLAWTAMKIIAIVAPIMICVAYLTLWERKMIGWMHVRIGPNRVGPLGLFQPIADGLKLLLKEIIVPAKASKALFVIAPIMTIMPALAAWAVVPFSPDVVLANVNAGLLFVMAITSMEVYGVIIAGWASNSKYAFLGAMRASAQM